MEIYEHKQTHLGINFKEFSFMLKNLLLALETHLRELEITETL